VTLWGAVGALAVVAALPLGSVIVQTVGWPGIFFLNLPVGLAAVLIGRVIISESRDETVNALPDLFGVLLLIVGAALLAFGIVQSETWGWGSAWVWGALALGAVVLLAFVMRSSRAASPALDLTLFQDRTFSLANAALFVFSIGFTANFFGSIMFLTRMWGYTLVQAGLAMTPGPVMVVLLAPIAGRIAAVRGHRRLLLPGGLLYAAGALRLLLAVTPTPHFLTVWLPSTLLTGMGVALVLPVLSSAAVQHLPPQKLAVGSGVSQATRQFGSVLGVALTLAILGHALNTIMQYQPVFLLMIAGGLSVSALSLGIDTLRLQGAARRDLVQPQVGFE